MQVMAIMYTYVSYSDATIKRYLEIREKQKYNPLT